MSVRFFYSLCCVQISCTERHDHIDEEDEIDYSIHQSCSLTSESRMTMDIIEDRDRDRYRVIDSENDDKILPILHEKTGSEEN